MTTSRPSSSPRWGLFMDPDHPYVNEEWLERTREEILDPEISIVDALHHVFWSEPFPYRVEALAADVGSGHNIVATVYSGGRTLTRPDGPEHLRTVNETEVANGLAATSMSGELGAARLCAAIVMEADFRHPRVEEALEAHAAATSRFRGAHAVVRQDPALETLTVTPPGLLRDDSFRRGFACLGRMGLVAQITCYHTQLAEVVDLAGAFPETPMALKHFGGPIGIGSYANRKDEVLEKWRRGVRDLRSVENVYMKLGGLANAFNWDMVFRDADAAPSSVQVAEAYRPFVEGAIEAIGPDRCMFESNFPIDKAKCSYAVLWNAFKRLMEGSSKSDRQAVFSRTAERFYTLSSGKGEV